MEYQTHLGPFNAGQLQERTTDIGRTNQDGRPTIWRNCPHLAQLRVGWIYPERVAERWTGDIFVPGIGPIGPIDLPFTFNVEQPVSIAVRPLSAPAADNEVVLLLCDLQNVTDICDATYLVFNDTNAITPIAPWVVAVTVLGDPTTLGGQYLDASNTVISTFLGPGPVVRPRAAVGFQCTGTSGAAVFHY